MSRKRHPLNAAKFTGRFFAANEGSLLVELGLILVPLILLLVYATDYALGRLADAQVQNAVVAAANYAQTKGCNTGGMIDAANSSMNTDFARWVTDKPEIHVEVFCGCSLSKGEQDEIVGNLETIGGVPPSCTENLCPRLTTGTPPDESEIAPAYQASPYVKISTPTTKYVSFLTHYFGQMYANYSIFARTFTPANFDSLQNNCVAHP